MTGIENNKDAVLASAWSDKHTADYVSQWGELVLHKKVPELCQLLSTDIVLDIGCGSGAAVRAIVNKLTSGHVTGIDPTAKMLEIAAKLTIKDSHSQRVSFLLAGAENIPVKNESCDVVIAVNTLHHWLNVNQGLNEVLRILKPSGRFVTIDDLWEESMEYQQIPTDDQAAPHSSHQLKTRNGIVNLLNSKGFLNISNIEHREPDATASIITGYKA